jgi:hypothetical protein
VESRVLAEPSHHLLMLVRGVVIGDYVDAGTARRFVVDLLQESEPLHMRVVMLRALISCRPDNSVQQKR